MQAQDSLMARPRTQLGQPVPELPVRDVERARAHYRDHLGFDLGWIYPGNEIGSVHREGVVLFFRQRVDAFEPAVHWLFCVDVNATHEEMKARGAHITDPLATKPWNLTQFTVEDPDGNRFYFHG
jgi:catechol 2,3-dioxygenase-like lactoylglutathione lyase family enzyme